MANIIINQVGIPAGVAGKSRSDGVTGALVTLTHDEPSAVFTEFSLLWVPEDDATAAASFSQVGDTATFTPDSNSLGGTYRIKLTVATASSTSETIRLFAIRTEKAGLRIPALNEKADEVASLVNNGEEMIAKSEFNENADDGPFADGNYGGWYSSMVELYHAVEQQTAPPTVADTTWEIMYEKDLRTLSSETFSTTAEYKNITIDGKPWATHIGGGTGSAVALVNGQGLRISAGSGAYKQSGNPYAGTCAFIRTEAWPGLDRTKEIALAVQFAGPTPTDDFTSPSELGVCSYAGTRIWGLGGNGAQIYVVNPIFGANSGTVQAPTLYFNLSPLFSINIPISVNTNDHDKWSMAVAACPFNSNTSRPPSANLRSAWWKFQSPGVVGLPAPDEMKPFYQHNGTGLGENADWLLGVYTGNRNINGVVRHVYITHVRVLQRTA